MSILSAPDVSAAELFTDEVCAESNSARRTGDFRNWLIREAALLRVFRCYFASLQAGDSGETKAT